MKQFQIKHIRSLLEKGETEDLNNSLELIIFHIDHSRHKEKELDLIIDGIQKNIPVPYIIGYTLVCGFKIIINNSVLNPGPETITLINKATEYMGESIPFKVLDLCTGSGAVAISLSKKCNLSITATDISESALLIAKSNALENGVNINFLLGNLFEPIKGLMFDVIVTNPPYVKSSAINTLPSYVRDFAPVTAIDGGEDGLFFHREILSKAKYFLYLGGSLFIECEDNQDKELEKLASIFNWEIGDRFVNKHGNVRGFRLIKK